jgi:hypothetical protein
MRKLQFALCSTLLVFSQVALADTHCTNTEKVVFSCSFGKKMVSICASSDLSASAGYMQYRFGAKDKVELQYPQSQVHPRGKFSVKRQTPVLGDGTRAKLTEVSFTQGDIKYIVDSMDTGSTDKTTLDVERNGKQLASLVCNNASIVNKDFSYYEILDSFVDANNAVPVKQAQSSPPKQAVAQSSPPKQAAPQPSQKSDNAANAYRVMTKNRFGYDVNACAEYYYLSVGMAEWAKHNPQAKSWLGGATPEQFIASQDTMVEYEVIYKLMSDAVRRAKKSSSVEFVVEAQTASAMNKYNEFIRDFSADMKKYSAICMPVLDQLHGK